MHRYTDTDRWQEDWYCELGGEYQSLWDYICNKCDNAGVWKPNKIDFETKTKFKVNLDSFFKKVNGDKERIILLENGRWFLPGFIKYQWFTKKDTFSLSMVNNLHISLYKIISGNHIPLEKVRGLTRVCLTSREKDNTNKEVITTNNNSGNNEPSGSPKADPSIIEVQDLTLPRPPNAPELQAVIEFFYQQGKAGEQGKKEAERFFNHFEGLGWRKGISPIVAWRSFASNWISNPLQFNNNGTTRGAKQGATGIIPGDKEFGKF